MLLSIALFTGIFCAGCGARSDEILLESQEDTSDTVEETEQEEREMTDEIPSMRWIRTAVFFRRSRQREE